MNKTKSRLSAIVVLTSVLVLGVLALSTGIASEDSSPLNDWNGTWLNVGTMLDDPAMDAVYEAMTDAANAAAGDGTPLLPTMPIASCTQCISRISAIWE